MEKGEKVQADDPNAVPIEVIETDNTTIEKFRDGSARATGVSGGSCISGSGYKECKNVKAYYSYASTTMQFRADYGTYNGKYDKIHRAYNASFGCAASSNCTWGSFDGNASTETSSRKATATFNINNASRSNSLQLVVGGNKAYSRNY